MERESACNFHEVNPATSDIWGQHRIMASSSILAISKSKCCKNSTFMKRGAVNNNWFFHSFLISLHYFRSQWHVHIARSFNTFNQGKTPYKTVIFISANCLLGTVKCGYLKFVGMLGPFQQKKVGRANFPILKDY